MKLKGKTRSYSCGAELFKAFQKLESLINRIQKINLFLAIQK